MNSRPLPLAHNAAFFLLLAFLLFPGSTSSHAQQGLQRQTGSANLANDETTPDFTLFLMATDPSDELDCAVRSLGLPTRQREGKKGMFIAIVQAGKEADLRPPGELKADESDEG